MTSSARTCCATRRRAAANTSYPAITERKIQAPSDCGADADKRGTACASITTTGGKQAGRKPMRSTSRRSPSFAAKPFRTELSSIPRQQALSRRSQERAFASRGGKRCSARHTAHSLAAQKRTHPHLPRLRRHGARVLPVSLGRARRKGSAAEAERPRNGRYPLFCRRHFKTYAELGRCVGGKVGI